MCDLCLGNEQSVPCANNESIVIMAKQFAFFFNIHIQYIGTNSQGVCDGSSNFLYIGPYSCYLLHRIPRVFSRDNKPISGHLKMYSP